MAKEAAPGVLRRAGESVEGRPARVLAVLALVTIVLGFFAAQRVTSGDLELFATASELADRQSRVDEPIAAAARVEGALLSSPWSSRRSHVSSGRSCRSPHR